MANQTATPSKDQGVALPEGHTGSTFFHSILAEALEAFPEVFVGCKLPTVGKGFKKKYADFVTCFEAARTTSSKRAEIAQFLANRCLERMEFVDDERRVALGEHLTDPPMNGERTLEQRSFKGTAGWVPEVPFQGRVYRGAEIEALVALLETRHHISENAAQGLRWILAHIAAAGGALDLSGHRFAMLGAGAELAPTDLLLRAGATVLWIDLCDPDESLQRRAPLDVLSGELVTAPHGHDLLVETAAVSHAIRAFADDGPVHLGLFAYAPGRGREIRLTAAMESIARAMPAGAIRSIGMYISPTTPMAVQRRELESAQAREAGQPLWIRALRKGRLLSTPGHVKGVACTTVPLQGPGYLAAQYLLKVMTAERWATLEDHPVTVSANVAAITNTQSLDHPLFQVAFCGATNFGIQIFDTETTRPLSALLWLRDLLDPDAPGACDRQYDDDNARANETMSQQIHGGVMSLPWNFNSVIRNATVIGAAKRPGKLFGR